MIDFNMLFEWFRFEEKMFGKTNIEFEKKIFCILVKFKLFCHNIKQIMTSEVYNLKFLKMHFLEPEKVWCEINLLLRFIIMRKRFLFYS